MGFEPTTPTLARLCSTPELHPRLPSPAHYRNPAAIASFCLGSASLFWGLRLSRALTCRPASVFRGLQMGFCRSARSNTGAVVEDPRSVGAPSWPRLALAPRKSERSPYSCLNSSLGLV